MISEVRRIFDDYVISIFQSKIDIKNFILKHERKEVCLQNLCEQIRIIELGRMDLSAHKYKNLIEGVAKMFCDAALKSKEEELITHAEKARRLNEASKLDQAKEMLKEAGESIREI